MLKTLPTQNESYNDIFEWCLNHVAYPANHTMISYDTTNSEYYIANKTINIVLNDSDTFLPYRISKCDDFSLESNNIKSFVNFPKTMVLSSRLPMLRKLSLKNTNKLDLSNLNKEYSEISLLYLINIKKICITDLKNIFVDEIVTFDNVNDLSIYDVCNFIDLDFRRLEYMHQTHKFKNLQHIVSCKHLKCFYINYSNVYTTDETRLLRDIIDKFTLFEIAKRKEHIMDMTIDLLDNNFDYECS